MSARDEILEQIATLLTFDPDECTTDDLVHLADALETAQARRTGPVLTVLEGGAA